MDDNQYKIKLGIELDDSGLRTEINRINKLDNSAKVKLGVDLKVNDIRDRIRDYNKNTNNAKLKLGVKLDTDDLKRQINQLNKPNGISGKGVAIPVNTQSLEVSLREVKDIIASVQKSLGTLDDGAGMKSLVSSVNQIATALGKATDESETLINSLNTLSKKDFNINVGVDVGKKNFNTIGYGRAARKQVIPQLEAQIDYLENLYGGKNEAVKKLMGANIGFDIFTDFNDFNSDSAIRRMEAMEKYINSLKKLANINNIDLSGFNDNFSKDASELINDITGVSNAVDGAEDTMKRLKGVFGSGVDGEKLSAQLDSIVTDLNEIKTALQGLSSGTSLDGLTASFNKLSDSIELLIKNCATAKDVVNDVVGNAGAAGQSGSGFKNVENDLKQVESAAESASDAIKQTANEIKKANNISIDISDGDIDDIKNALRNMDVDDSDIEKATKELNELDIAAKKVSATLKSDKPTKIEITGVETAENGLKRLVTATTTFGEKGTQSSIKYSQAMDEIAVAAEKIQTKLNDTGFNGFEQEVKRAHAEAQRFENSADDLATALQRLDAAFEAISLADQVGDQKALVAANKEYIESLKQVQSITKLKEQESNLTLAKERAQLKLNSLFGDNSEAARRFATELDRIQKELNECGSVKGVKQLEKQMNNLAKTANSANLKTQTFGQRLKEQWSRYSSYLSVASVFMYAEQGLRDMFEQVKLIDSAMTELKKVTDETDASYNQFLTNAASRAKEIGTTIDGLVSSTADFARLGYDFADAQGLAEVANIYAVVGDDIDSVETATQSLISTLTAFKNEAGDLSNSDFALSIVDKMNEVANNFAISSGGIGEALQRSASSMMAANNSLDETIALITAANTVVQDPDAVGTAFKTISMRIRGAKTEMEAAGLETDGMASSTAKLREEILALSGVDIMLNANEFKSTYQIMEELANKWQSLTDIQQASVTELIAGKRQGNIVSSLMNNFDIAEQALETSLNSAGSAMKEHEKWQQSLEAQILSLKASWQGLSQAFLSSDFLKGTLDAIIALVDGVTKLIDTIGAVPTLMLGFGAIKSLPKLFGSILKSSSLGKNSAFTELVKVLFDVDLGAKKSDKSIKSLISSLLGVNSAAGGAGGALKSIGSSLLGLVKAHPIVAAAVLAVTALTAAFMHQKKEAEELANEVQETVSSYKEQHNELIKLKNDYDTSNENSMISKYAELSRGVDGLGRNISLTADEYSEYQSIVNNIAEQIPSLVSGYDEQGNAILSCKGNVEELTEAYEKLIHAQNNEVLSKAGDIEKDFTNTLKEAEKGSFLGIGNKVSASSIELIEKALDGGYSEKEIETLLKNAGWSKSDGVYEALKSAGIGDMGAAWTEGEIADTLTKTLKEDPTKIKGVIDNYYAQFEDAVEEQKTIAQAKLSEAFDVSSAISGLNYGNINEDLQNVAYQVVNSFDYDFLSSLSESGKSLESWVTEMLNQLNAISEADNAQIEAAFDLQTEFNGGEISYGEYVKSLKDVESTIDGLNLKDEAKNQLKLSLDLDEDGIIEQYEALVNRLTDSKNYDFDISENEARKLLDGLSSEELSVAVDVITEMSNNDYSETANEIKTAIERELAIQGLSIDLTIEEAKVNFEALSTAITESFSSSGLSEESISAIEGIFGSLKGYNSSKLFERTANGIRLNSEEFRKLNSESKKTNLAQINKQMDSLGDIYNQTREELYRLSYGTDEYNDKLNDLNNIEQQIKDLEKLEAGYRGVASAFQEWQMVESAGSQRDMYESLIEGLENVDDEIKRGWYDDGTIEYLELLTGKDLSTAGIEEVKKAYKGLGKEIEHTSYSVRDFFTVDDDGNSTNAGVYNFLDAIGQLEEEKFGGKDVVKRKDGKIVGFDFQIVGGDEVIAEALGISEELVQIMVRAADDAGFVVSMDGTYQQLDVLKEKAQEAAESLNRTLENSGKKGFDFNFNTSNVDDIKNQLTEAQKILDTFRNTDGTINTKLEGADEALTVASTLQSMLDKLTRPAYMEIEVSQVEDELQEPLRNLQELQRLTETEHQLKLTGADTSELEKSKQEVYEYFEGLDSDVKVKLGLVDENGNPLTGQSLKNKLNSGDIAIEATVDIQMKMDDKLGILVDKALLDAGIIDGEEFEKRVDIYLNADVDNEEAKNKTEQAVNEVTGNKSGGSNKDSGTSGNKAEVPVDVKVEAGEVETTGFWDKVKSWWKNTFSGEESESTEVETDVSVEAGEIDTSGVEKKVSEAISKVTELEVRAEEVGGLVQDLESKDITIDVTVNGLDDVKELNKNIDLATKIDGNVDKLSEYVEGAKELSKLDDNITSYVTANIEGNVKDTPEIAINNLEVFAKGAEALKGIGSFSSKVTADIDGNVKDTPEFSINNLKVFSDSAKEVESIGEDVRAKVTADVDGDVVWHPEEMLDNLKAFSDSAKEVASIGEDVKAKVTADIDGNVKGLFEEQIDNLSVFVDSAKEIESIGKDVKAKVTADIDGNVKDLFEEQIDNIKIFSDSAKEIESVGEDVKAKVTADVDGNVKDLFEEQINNLKVYSDSAKEVGDIGEVSSKTTVDVKGNIVRLFDDQIDNLKVYSDSAKEVESIGDVSSSVRVDIKGNVKDLFEEQIDNLKVYSDNAKEIDGIGDISSSVTANIKGDVIWTPEGMLNNIREFAEGARELSDISDVSRTVSANIDGDVVWHPESMLNNLREFAEGARELADTQDVSRTVEANVNGDAIWHPEGMLNNLNTFAEGAKELSSVPENISRTIEANINGDVVWHTEGMLDNVKVFAESAKTLDGVGSPSSTVTANISGNVTSTSEGSINKIGIFADNAKEAKGVGNFTSSVTANVSGNITTDDTVVSDLEHFASVVSGMSSQTVAVSVTANVDSANINSAIDLLTKVGSSGVFKDYKATVQVGAKIATIDDAVVQNYNAPKKDGKVAYTVDSSAVDTWTAPTKDGVVNYSASVEALTDAQKHKTGTITYKAKIVGGGVVNGTANADGTTEKAFKQGSWGTNDSGVALMGELGRETIVRDGKFFTVGDDGAGFYQYKKGDIIFNHKQTEELFKNGKVTSGGGRGRAFAEGTAFAGGSTGYGGAGKVNSITGKSYGKSSSSSSDDSKDEFEETIDWIEVAIDRIERVIDQLDTKVNSVYRSWSERNSNLVNEISKVREEINLQQRAYNEYMAAANAVGLSSSYAEKVRNGTIDIETIKDETLKEKIDDYQNWYEKALDCQDAILDLKETEAELYAQRFEHVQSEYDGVLQGYEHTEAMLNEYISQAEERGHIVSKKYYQALIDNEKSNIAELKKEQADLIAARDEAVNSGTIAKYSEEWYSMCAEIDGVTQAIEESTTALLEYDNAMREIDWSIFDLIQERISAISEETEFLIELMSNDKLFDDDGKLTSQGLATMGLHAQNYNAHMYQADEYGAEVAKLDAQIKKDPYDQELINRRNELLELQRESILAAEDEKSAIADLVEEGIELELDALDERIEKYKEALDSQKDLYDYQKKVSEQTENISSLQKQLSAYSGDDSEEAKAKVQELKLELKDAENELKETEYEKLIQDSEVLLDTLYSEYELILNQRLDNVDYLLEQVIESINAAAGADGTIASALGSEGAIAIAVSNNATSIKETLTSEAKSVGTTLSSAMNNIWSVGDGNAKSVLTMYGEDFRTKSTTTNTVLNSIKTSVNSMVAALNKEATTKTTANKTSSSAKKNPTTSSTTKKTTATKKSSGDGTPKIGDRVKYVSGQYYYDSQGKKPLGSHKQGEYVYITNINKRDWATHGYHISTGKKLGDGDLGWLKLNQLSGYATGKKNFSEDEVAWTQEDGLEEYIIRPSDGAILTPIARKGSVLNAQASSNLWDMTNSPAEFIRDNLNLGSANVPNGSSVQNVYNQTIENVSFDFENVKNYEEMLHALKDDRRFEKLITAITIDRVAGKSSLSKGKSIK